MNAAEARALLPEEYRWIPDKTLEDLIELIIQISNYVLTMNDEDPERINKDWEESPKPFYTENIK